MPFKKLPKLSKTSAYVLRKLFQIEQLFCLGFHCLIWSGIFILCFCYFCEVCCVFTVFKPFPHSLCTLWCYLSLLLPSSVRAPTSGVMTAARACLFQIGRCSFSRDLSLEIFNIHIGPVTSSWCWEKPVTFNMPVSCQPKDVELLKDQTVLAQNVHPWRLRFWQTVGVDVLVD